MPKTNIYNNTLANFINATFELIKWPPYRSFSTDDKVLALQTTRFALQQLQPFPLNDQQSVVTSLDVDKLSNEKSPFNSFNLGLHVGDNADQVIYNRNQLKHFIRQQLVTALAISAKKKLKK